MDYEKKYRDALKRAKAAIDIAADKDLVKGVATTIFPELRESEDETIRKEIIDIVEAYRANCVYEGTHRFDDCLAYLEKQKDLDKMIVVSPEVWDNAISDAFENGKKEGEHPEKQKPSAPNKYDEKMRKKIIDHLESIKMGGVICTIDTSEEIAWLEKQKDASKAIEAVDRIDKYIDEQLANAHDMKDSNPDKKYYRGWDDALGKMAGILQDVYSEKENKFAPRVLPCSAAWFEDGDEKQKEQKPNIELIQRSWYMEGYHDREFGKEPKWIIKTGDGGPKHELNPKYGQSLAKNPKEQKPVEKQDYSDLADLERAIHRGFLSAGVENVPVTIIKETAKECLAQMEPAEWSEEDEEKINDISEIIKHCMAIPYCGGTLTLSKEYKKELQCFIKSLRPSWKPSEEQMEAMEFVIKDYREDGCTATANYLQEILDQIKKL